MFICKYLYNHVYYIDYYNYYRIYKASNTTQAYLTNFSHIFDNRLYAAVGAVLYTYVHTIICIHMNIKRKILYSS